MRKLLSLMIGLSLGGAFGAVVMSLVPSETRGQMVANLKEGWDETMVEARKASRQKKIELRAELAAKRRKNQPTRPALKSR